MHALHLNKFLFSHQGVENFGVDPTSKDFKYGEIKTLTNEEARRMEIMDYDDIRRAENAEARMEAAEQLNAGAAKGCGGANFWH